MYQLNKLSIMQQAQLAIVLGNWASGAVTPTLTTSGICGNLNIGGDGAYLVAELAAGWAHHSGSSNFPVPDPAPGSRKDFFADTELACMIYCRVMDLWAGKYGELRRDLCRYMAEKVACKLGMY